MKTCNRCGLTKDLAEFTTSVGKTRSRCKVCEAELARTRRAENPQPSRDAQKRYHAARPGLRAASCRSWRDANPEKVQAYRDRYEDENRERSAAASLAYYYAHHDHRLKKMREWKQDNREAVAAYKLQYNRTHVDMCRAWNAKRKARKRDAEGSYTGSDVAAQYERQHGTCYWCDKKVDKKYHVDHVIPLARGGGNGPENIVIACRECNCSKHAKLPWEWEPSGRLC